MINEDGLKLEEPNAGKKLIQKKSKEKVKVGGNNCD